MRRIRFQPDHFGDAQGKIADMNSSETKETAEASADSGKTLDDLSSSHIGKRLRTMYDEVVSEPVPDKFLDLLESLERAEEERSNG